MSGDHLIEFGHDRFVRNQLAAIGRIDADLDESQIFGLFFGGAFDRLSGEPAAAAPLRLCHAVDQSERFGVKSSGDY